MLRTQDAEDILRKINDRQARYSSIEAKSPAFQSVLSERLAQIQTINSSNEFDETLLLPLLEQILKQPELVDLDLLVKFISEVNRFVENVGIGNKFAQDYIDRAIAVYKKEAKRSLALEDSLLDLYLAKANYLRLARLEHAEREAALKEAQKIAVHKQDKEGLIKVLLALAVYYTEVSLYEKSIAACKECEYLLKKNTHLLDKYYPRVLTNYAMNYFPLLAHNAAEDYLLQARELLDKKLLEQDQNGDSYVNKRTMATTFHYLGRIAEAKGNLQDAMRFYVDGEKHQQMCPEELSATAFYHLRLGELLIAANCLQEAKDHIRESQDFFYKIHFASSGRIQTSLACASIYSKEGKYTEARKSILEAITDAQQKNFSRGELLCLVKLFWLELKHFRIYSAIHIFFQAMATWRSGELKRNGGFKLVTKYLLQVLLTPWQLLRRSPHTVLGTAAFNSSIDRCICPIHLVKSEK